jgi:hypothetical protein
VCDLADVQQAHGAANVQECTIGLHTLHHTRHNVTQVEALHRLNAVHAAVAEQQALVLLRAAKEGAARAGKGREGSSSSVRQQQRGRRYQTQAGLAQGTVPAVITGLRQALVHHHNMSHCPKAQHKLLESTQSAMERSQMSLTTCPVMPR